MAEIKFVGIHKSFGAVKVFRGIHLTCPDQGYLCLLGPSGCGKTTLMRMLAGLASADAGDILIGERRVNDLSPGARNVGLAFQNYALYPHLSVAENLAFPLRAPIRRKLFDEAEVKRRVDAMAQLLKIDWLLARRINQLSGGQQQRVSLGRSLIRDPSVLLLDEPVTHLDARLRYEMRTELKILHRRMGTTTIHVTHDQQEALAVADEIAVMRDGHVEQKADPNTLYNHPATAFVASFIGDPPMSILSAQLTSRDGEPALRIGEAELPLPDELRPSAERATSPQILVGVRPANVTLAEASAQNAIPAIVYTRETLGRETQFLLTIENDRLRYRTPGGLQAKVGDQVRIALSLKSALLFDGPSGKAL